MAGAQAILDDSDVGDDVISGKAGTLTHICLSPQLAATPIVIPLTLLPPETRWDSSKLSRPWIQDSAAKCGVESCAGRVQALHQLLLSLAQILHSLAGTLSALDSHGPGQAFVL